MLCSVIPYTRSIDDRLVTYDIPEECRPFIVVGSSVRVPWWKESIIGIVANIAKDIPYEGVLKSIEGPHSTVPLLSASEISLVVQLARHLFVRIHTIAQLFIPLSLFDALEDKNFLELTPPKSIPTQWEIVDYIVAPDPETIAIYLGQALQKNPGAVIVPDGISVQWWYDACWVSDATLDTHPKSIVRQKKIYLEMLSGVHKNLFGTRRTLLKRLGHFRHIYIVHENLSRNILFWLRKIPVRIMLEQLSQHGHIIHYITTTPSIRTLTHFLQEKKSVQYLESQKKN